MRHPEKILGEAAKTLDFSQPIASCCWASCTTSGTVRPARHRPQTGTGHAGGSYLAICHLTADIYPEMADFAAALNERKLDAPLVLRDRAQVTSFFDGLELVEPGVVQLSKWRPRPRSSRRPPPPCGAGWPASPRSPAQVSGRDRVIGGRTGAHLHGHHAFSQTSRASHPVSRLPATSQEKPSISPLSKVTHAFYTMAGEENERQAGFLHLLHAI